MVPRPRVTGFAPSALLLSCALAAPSFAEAIPFTPPAVVHGVPVLPIPAPAVRAVSPRADFPTALAPRVPSRVSDGTWQEFNLLQVSYAATVFEPSPDRVFSIGGSRLGNYALPLRGARGWEPLPPAEPAEYMDMLTTAVDPSTGLVYYVAFGGGALEIHTLDPERGTVRVIHATGDAPAYAIRGGMVFDPGKQRLVVIEVDDPYFGGADPEVFVLDLLPTPTWSQWHPSGTPFVGFGFGFPTPAVLDPVRRRMVFPTAIPDSRGNNPSIWALTLDGAPEWLHFASSRLPDGSLYSSNPLAYDSSGDRLVTIGADGDLIALSLASFHWSFLPDHGPGPSSRFAAGIVVDPVRHRLITFGGTTPSRDDVHSDAWVVSLALPTPWSRLVPDAERAPIRGAAGDGYDRSRSRLVVFGGSNELGGVRNDTWVVDLSGKLSWSPLATTGGPPPPRYWHASTWDPVRDQLLVFGGFSGDFTNYLADLWALSFGNGVPTWSQLAPPGPAPSGRATPGFVYDSKRDRFLLLFGGSTTVLDDVWELRLSPAPAWRRLAPQGSPPAARAAAMCVYDENRDRVWIFGGSTSDAYFNDLWALNLGAGDGAWESLDVPSGPTERSLGLLRFDPVHDRLLLFGGFGLIPSQHVITYLDETWALELAGSPAWRPLSPAGFRPAGRDRTCGAYDAANDRLVIAAGGIQGANDLWSLSFHGGRVALPPPPGTMQELAPEPTLALRARSVAGRVSFTVELPSSEPASLELFDLAGRRVWSTAVGQLGRGAHEVNLAEASLSPAIYFARVRQGPSQKDARVAIMR